MMSAGGERDQRARGYVALRQAQPGRAQTVHVQAQRRVIEHLRACRTSTAPGTCSIAVFTSAAYFWARSKLASCTWTSMGAGRPKLSTWVTMSAFWK